MSDKKILSRGLTLTELIIATIIVAFMMIGLAAADFAIRRMDRDVANESKLYIRMVAAAEDIRRSASLAIGDINNMGIILSATSMCFRLDLSGTPSNYADDTWRCYTVLNNNIRTCDLPAAAACTATDRAIGTVVNNVYTCSACYAPRLIQDAASHAYYLEFQLVSRVTVGPTVNAYVADGRLKETDPSSPDNPQVAIQYRVVPQSHSF